LCVYSNSPIIAGEVQTKKEEIVNIFN